MSKTFFSSDTHYLHNNIINLSKRPFTSVEQMNDTMIYNHNSVVSNNDDYWHLGDFAYRGNPKESLDILRRLKGRKHLIIGNHDNSEIITSPLWESVTVYKEIKIDGHKVVLFHYPILEWNGYFRGSYHLYGHVHNNLPPYHERAIDVGVDNQEFMPRTFQELVERHKNRAESLQTQLI